MDRDAMLSKEKYRQFPNLELQNLNLQTSQDQVLHEDNPQRSSRLQT